LPCSRQTQTNKGFSEVENYLNIRYEFLTPQEIIAARQRLPVVLVPLGPMEWHAPHLPLGVDMLHAYSVALAEASELGGLVIPPLPLGTETVLEEARLQARGFKGNEKIIGMDFPGFPLRSLYNEDSAFGVVLRDLIRGLKRQLFKVIVIVNGHGGHNHLATIKRICVEETEPGEVEVIVGFAFDTSSVKDGHAERYETSFMRAFYPDTVDLNMLPPLPKPLKNVDYGILDEETCLGHPTPDFTVRESQDPRFSDLELGKQDLKNCVTRIDQQIREALARIGAGNLVSPM
jgi:creatinine amidohydrolase